MPNFTNQLEFLKSSNVIVVTSLELYKTCLQSSKSGGELIVVEFETSDNETRLTNHIKYVIIKCMQLDVTSGSAVIGLSQA